eukprot:CAMPEP_0178616700 /NCGR_PEP_ID=MMETSP0698-20121128/3344_1 /TAXON_ID=265572 /ORGANISM="Extubocellulus spinifer, Strain CCMP396" /LENGTH=257 /DNA_ID=CAMNT_0020255533 /DNA_START=177 /DNA_END=946 /DNA_ORIENTATION=+
MYSSSFVNHEARRDEVRKHKRACTTIQHHSVSLLLAQPNNNDDNRPNEPLASKARRALLASSAAALTYNAIILGPTLGLFTPPGYKRISPIQFIAALGDRDASSGNGADSWGLWSTDPGPRGLRLRDYEKIKSSTSSSGGETVRAPPWLNEKDFFLDENAIIMPQPEFPLPAGKYLVTGGRMVTTGLTIEPSGQWKLDSGKLYDVTHLPCRAARYRPNSEGGSPLTVQKSDFPVVPGAVMPKVPGTDKQDYAVLFIV